MRISSSKQRIFSKISAYAEALSQEGMKRGKNGAADGTRTRDPRRDRPVF